MRLVYITLARKILCYGSFPAKVLLGTNAYNSLLFYQLRNRHFRNSGFATTKIGQISLITKQLIHPLSGVFKIGNCNYRFGADVGCLLFPQHIINLLVKVGIDVLRTIEYVVLTFSLCLGLCS